VYLRRVRYGDGYHFVIRESYGDGDCIRNRDIMDLGPHPENCVEYPGGNGFYIDPSVEEMLQAKGVEYTAEELEQLFMPFLPFRIRRVIEQFRCHRSTARDRESSVELLEKQRGLHSFDKRRIHFLKFGRVDMGDLEGRPWKFLNVLIGKSRDEIEHTIEEMERGLQPREIRPYVYTALNLQSCFPSHLLRNQPAGLDREKVDAVFLDEICRLNRDNSFFRGVEDHDSCCLHSILARYVILYFDHEFPGITLNDYLNEFMRSRFRNSVRQRPVMALESACRLFGITVCEFEGMSEKDLVRVYRRTAHKVHPDKGGSQDGFVQVTEAYECLLARKRRQV